MEMTDIDDSPPDPSRPMSASQLQPKEKPWERGSVSSGATYTAVHTTPLATVADNFVLRQQQESFGNLSNSPQQSMMSATGNSFMTEVEAAAGARPKSTAAATGYDFSHLLGSHPTASDAPWRPPPPPAPTVTAAMARPTSSGSFSSRTAVPATPPIALAAVPEVRSTDSSSIEGETDAAQQVVAHVAADVVKNVVASATLPATESMTEAQPAQ
jgi:hypothetical protein